MQSKPRKQTKKTQIPAAQLFLGIFEDPETTNLRNNSHLVALIRTIESHVITFKAVHGLSLEYITDLIPFKTQSACNPR